MTKRLCSVDDCERSHYSKSYCRRHYYQLRTGQPFSIPWRDRSLDERFDAFVQRSKGCWTWTGAVKADGYGQFFLGKAAKNIDWLPDRVQISAHRFSFAREHRYWPSEYILHHCDTPPCVRPDHLYEGTQQDNANDMMARSRTASLEKNGFARLTADDVRNLRAGSLTPQQISKLRKVHVSTSYLALAGKTWKSLDQ